MIAAAALVSAVVADRYLPREAGRRDLVALATAAAGGAAAMSLSPGAETMGFRLLLVVLAAAAVIDVRSLRIPNVTSLLAAVCALVAWFEAGAQLAPLLVGMGVAAMMLVAFMLGGAGGGDVKMLPTLVLAAIAPVADPLAAIAAASAILAATFTLALGFHALSGAGRGRSALGPSMLVAGLGALVVAGIA